MPTLARQRSIDPLLVVIPLLLVAMGIVVIYSLTSDQTGFTLWAKQIMFAIAGLAVGGFLWLTDYRLLVGIHWWILGITLSLLLLTLFIGDQVFGAKSWIDFGFFTLQPGELAKFSLILSGSSLLFGSRERYVPFANLALYCSMLLLTIALIMAQPDFGTTTVHVVVAVVLLLVAPLRRYQRYLLMIILAGALAIGVLAYRGVAPFDGLMKDYQRNRITSLIFGGDTRQSAYNVDQALIAIGSGGITGQGIGFGTQSQLNFLPVVHSDFIAAAIGEAWGFIGMATLIALVSVLCLRLLVLHDRVRDPIGRGVIIGSVTVIAYQSLVSIGMNVKIMPVTGIPLPFVSSGGTALVTYLALLGLVLSVGTRSAVDREPQTW